jgi:hypothetical protein
MGENEGDLVCVECGYRKRHGECGDQIDGKDSDYTVLYRTLIYDYYIDKYSCNTKLGFVRWSDCKDIYLKLFQKIDSGEITRDNVGEWV